MGRRRKFLKPNARKEAYCTSLSCAWIIRSIRETIKPSFFQLIIFLVCLPVPTLEYLFFPLCHHASSASAINEPNGTDCNDPHSPPGPAGAEVIHHFTSNESRCALRGIYHITLLTFHYSHARSRLTGCVTKKETTGRRDIRISWCASAQYHHSAPIVTRSESRARPRSVRQRRASFRVSLARHAFPERFVELKLSSQEVILVRDLETVVCDH